MEVKNYFATDSQGNVLGSAQVYLYMAGTTTLAAGLQNISGAALANPFTSQSNGLVQFKAPDADYDLRVVKPGREFTIRIQCFDGIAFMGRITTTPTANGIPQANSDGTIAEGWIPPSVTYKPFLTLEQCGVSSDNSAEENGAALISAILSGVSINGSSKPYTFDFSGSTISFSGSVLQINLGAYLHTFLNWPGIIGNNVAILNYSGRIDASGGYCKGLGRFRRLIRANIGILEFQNVFIINPSGEEQFFGVEYSSNNYGDNQLQITIDSIYIKNVRTQTYAQSTGLAMPMTVLGNFGSESSQVKQHQVNIGNFHVEEYYCVSQDGATPIDGDSDVMRLFTNPTQVNIGSIYAKNIAKRFFKTQESALISCPNVYWSNDARFPQNVFIGFFEGQIANSGAPSHFQIGVCEAYNADGTERPLLFNASGLDHSISIGTLHYKNVGFYSSNRDVGITVDVSEGTGLSVLANASTRTNFKRIKDAAITNILVARGVVENFEITFDTAKANSTLFFLVGLHFKRGSFLGWRVNNRVAQFFNMEDVTVNYASGDSYVRGFQPITGGLRRATGVTVNDSTLLVNQVFEGPANGNGTFVVRDFRANGGVNIATGVFTTGTWDVRLDNCIPSTFTGAGASVKTASYL